MTRFGLIFDMDGVVADSTAAHTRSWARLAAEEGLAFDDAIARQMLGRDRRDSLAVVLAGRCLDGQAEEALLQRKQLYFLDELATVEALPGVRDLIAEARAAGVPLGLASSSRNVAVVLARLGLRDAFDVVVDGSTPCAPKPAPDLFLRVARALGLQPAPCTVLEDAEAGIAAALAGGFAVIALGGATGGHRDLTGLGG